MINALETLRRMATNWANAVKTGSGWMRGIVAPDLLLLGEGNKWKNSRSRMRSAFEMNFRGLAAVFDAIEDSIVHLLMAFYRQYIDQFDRSNATPFSSSPLFLFSQLYCIPCNIDGMERMTTSMAIIGAAR